MEQAMVVVFPQDDPKVCQVSFRRHVPLLILQAASIDAGQMRFGERKLGVLLVGGLDNDSYFPEGLKPPTRLGLFFESGLKKKVELFLQMEDLTKKLGSIQKLQSLNDLVSIFGNPLSRKKVGNFGLPAQPRGIHFWQVILSGKEWFLPYLNCLH